MKPIPMACSSLSRQLVCGLFVATFLAPSAAALAEEIAATPYRPTVSNPAELPLPGWLEIEWGSSRAKGGDNTWQNNQPYTLKYAFTPDFGVLVGGDVRARMNDGAGNTVSGRGDTSLLAKHHWSIADNRAYGLEWGVKFDTAAPGVGSGKNDYVLNGIYSVDVGDIRVDANLGATRLGLREAGLGQWQYGLALALSKEVAENWALAGELSGSSRRGQGPASQFMLAASYSASKRVVFDIGIVSGLSNSAPDWQIVGGVTILLANLAP
jgi:hypothetical protein